MLRKTLLALALLAGFTGAAIATTAPASVGIIMPS